jgi:hypothetical protein
MNDWEKVGQIGVDSGLCWIGDPCYCVTPDGENHPAKTWMEFCDKIVKNHTAQSWEYAPGKEGLGVSVSTGYGDGTYPVFIKRHHENGRVVAAMVLFADEDEEDESIEDEDIDEEDEEDGEPVAT